MTINQQDVCSFSCQWMDSFFLGEPSLCPCLCFFFFFCLQQPPALIRGIFLVLIQRQTLGQTMEKNQTCNHITDSTLDCPVVSTIMPWDKSAVLWFGILNRCDTFSFFFFFALQKSWSQSNRCLSHSNSCGMSHPDGRCGVWWTRVSPFFQCLDLSSALNSRPSRYQHLHCVSHKNSAVSRALYHINQGNMDQLVSLLHALFPSVHTMSSKEDQTVFALKICKHFSWQLNIYPDDSPFHFLSVCKSIVIYCSSGKI